jgi:inositol transport system substrate-binding protein
MKLRKLVHYFLVTLALLAAFTGCTKSDKKDKVVIGYSMPTFDDKWLSYMLDAAKAKADELSPEVEVIFTDAKNDSAKQMGQVETFVAQGVDVIVVCPVDTEATEPFTRIAKEANIPIVSVNRVFKNQDEATCFVGSESIKAGILQMEYIGKKLGGKGNIVLFRGEDGHEAARMRTEGVKKVIKEKYPDIKIVAEQTGKWQRTLGMQIMENWIQSGIKFDAVCSNNDEMAIGAIMALKEAKMLDKVLVGGTDGTIDALEYVKNGELDMTVYQNPVGQGAGAVEVAYKIAKGEKVEPYVWVPYELVPPEKVDEYIAKW